MTPSDNPKTPPFEPIVTDSMVVACNGGDGGLGHPRVFLNLAPSGKTECPYCSRIYVNRAAASEVAPDPAAGSGQEPGQPQPSG